MKPRVAAAATIIHVVIASCWFCWESATAAGGPPLANKQASIVASPTEGFFEGKDITVPAEAESCSGEGMMNVSVTLKNGQHVTACISDTASEEYVSEDTRGIDRPNLIVCCVG